MSEHTSGPWIADIRVGCVAVYPEGESHDCLSGIENSLLYYQHGKYVEGEGWTVNDEHTANARLIAAAPDLLSACKMLVTAYELEDSDMADEAVDLMQAAIEKAKGESS